jgi:hypothetical protein
MAMGRWEGALEVPAHEVPARFTGGLGRAIMTMEMRLLRWLGLCLALACTSTSAGSKTCEGDLAEVGSGCPAMFDGRIESVPACPSYCVYVAASRCNDLIVLDYACGGGQSCYYDSTSLALVGAEMDSDIPSYCGDSSYRKRAGRTPSRACAGAVNRSERSCAAEAAVDAGP